MFSIYSYLNLTNKTIQIILNFPLKTYKTNILNKFSKTFNFFLIPAYYKTFKLLQNFY